MWTIPLLLLVISLIESVVWEMKGNLLASIQSVLMAIVFAILVHKFTPFHR